MSKQSKLILDILENSSTYLSAIEIFQKAREVISNISLGTVYRNLKVLVLKNKIRKLSLNGDKDVFANLKNSHDYLVCKNCGKAFDLHIKKIHKVFSKATKKQFIDYNLTVFFICDDCKKKLVK